MADIEKVMNGLEHCLSRYVDGLCDDCPYMGAIDKTYMIPMKCKEIIMRDALELLKEQQADIEYMKSERTDAIEEIEREISVRERDPMYKTFSRGIVNGLGMALRIIKHKGR